ncbi:hypothetical protein ACFQZE_13485 [Paenibacillus sp. GCM10027627]|uniref:hypothetical protein n=1 Tax=unclassified Paenibacillus TaxID=185978 RepID=UPI003629BDA5
MILATMDEKYYESLSAEELGTACFAPIIRAYKEAETNGDDFVETVFNGLSQGQQQLFPIWALYVHIRKSETEFYWWSAYFMARPLRWRGVFGGLRFFGDTATLAVLEKMETELKARNHPRSLDRFDVAYGDLEQDAELDAVMKGLYGKLLDALPYTIEIISSSIRNKHEQFLELV